MNQKETERAAVQSQSESPDYKADTRSVPDKMKRRSIIRLMLVLLLAAYASYLFHEFGHWLVGTLLGNEMSMSLNGAWPTSGNYLRESHSLRVGIGGPAFTVLQAFIALVIIEKYETVLAYPFLIFPLVFRVFSLTLGEFSAQDEAGISATLGLGKYTVVIIVCSILFGLVWRGSRTLKLSGLVIRRFVVVLTDAPNRGAIYGALV